MRVLLFLIGLSCIGCSNNVKKMKQVYDDNQEIIQLFNNVSVFNEPRKNFVLVYTYNQGKRNEYIFSKRRNEYYLQRDSILFSPEEILHISEQNNPSYKQQLNEKVKFYVKKMDSLNISDISSEFISQGITLKVYMKSNAVLLYVESPSKVTNPEWITYMRSMKKIDDHWYYAEQDQ